MNRYYRNFEDPTRIVLASLDGEDRWLLSSDDGRLLATVDGGATEIEREARRALAELTGHQAEELLLRWEFRASNCPPVLFESAASMVDVAKIIQGGK